MREFVFRKKTPKLYKDRCKDRCLDRVPVGRKHPNRYKDRCQDSRDIVGREGFRRDTASPWAHNPDILNG